MVPDEIIEQLGAGQRPAVLVSLNGYEYRNTVGVMGGRHLISINAAIRQETGLNAGDPIRVVLTLADRPAEVTVPGDLAAALSAAPAAEAFFAKLPGSLRRYHVDNINAAKTAQTRQRRIDKAVTLFQEGRQR